MACNKLTVQELAQLLANKPNAKSYKTTQDCKCDPGACCACSPPSALSYCPADHPNPKGAADLDCYGFQQTYEPQGTFCSCVVTQEGDCWVATRSSKNCVETTEDQCDQDFRKGKSCAETNCGECASACQQDGWTSGITRGGEGCPPYPSGGTGRSYNPSNPQGLECCCYYCVENGNYQQPQTC